MDEFLLSEEQESEAREIEDLLKAEMAVEAQRIARMLASKPNAELFGALEFQVRERVHALGSQAAGLKCSTSHFGRMVTLHLGKVSERWM